MKKIEPARSERWMAIAFSEDRMMGDDAVIECVIDAGFVRVFSSYNDDKINKRMEDKTAGLSNAAGSYVNGVLECSFDHVKKDDFYPHLKDLNHDFYLMFADGDAISGNIFPHRYDVLPPVTDVPVDLQSMESVGGEGPRFPLVLAHEVQGVIIPPAPKAGCRWTGSNLVFVLTGSLISIVFQTV